MWHRFTNQGSPPTGVAIKSKKSLAVTRSSRHFHFFGYLNTPVSLFLKACRHLTAVVFVSLESATLKRSSVFVGSWIYSCRRNLRSSAMTTWFDPNAHHYCCPSEFITYLIARLKPMRASGPDRCWTDYLVCIHGRLAAEEIVLKITYVPTVHIWTISIYSFERIRTNGSLLLSGRPDWE